MPDVNQALFALLRAAFGNERPGDAQSVTRLDDAGWRRLCELAAYQGVLAVAWDGLRKTESLPAVPREVRIGWAVNVERIEANYARQKALIARLAGFLNDNGIRTMILKGYALSLCYPVPEHRPCGDIDIWLYGQRARADALLRANWGVEIDEDKHHHTTFVADGVMVENHYDFINIHAHASSRLCEQYLQEAARQPGGEIVVESTAADGPTLSGRIMIPPANLHALFLVRHAGAHFAAERIGLRHLADWMLFVTRYHDRIDWPWLECIARELGTHRFLNCLNALSIDCLGMDAALVPPFERDAELEKRVLDEILSPAFPEKVPTGNVLKVSVWKFRRWWANRWKHRIVYRENLFSAFFRLAWSHARKADPERGGE